MKSVMFNGVFKNVPIFQYLAMFTGNLNVISGGMHYAWPSPSLPKLLHEDSDIPMSSDQGSWVAVMILFGSVFGCAVGGILIDKIGRKNVTLLSSITFFASWIMIAYGQTPEVLMVGRFIAGASDGLIFCSMPMYLGEISNANIRGLLGSSVPVFWTFGCLLINIIGSQLDIKMTALISSSLPLLLLVTFWWMPESPYYLIMKGKLDEAKKSLIVFKGTKDVDDELARLVEAVKEQTTNTGKYLDLFTVKSNRKALYIVMGAAAAQQLTGTTAFMFYAQIIFKETGGSLSPTSSSNIYFGMQFVLSGLSSVIVDKTGRKSLMIISLIGCALVLLTESSYFYLQNQTDIDTTSFALVPIIALIIYVIVFNIGMQTIPFLLLSEIFPTNLKGFAVSFFGVYFFLIAAAISKFFQVTKDEFGTHVPFICFTVSCVFGLMFAIFYVTETKGRTLEEIQDDLKGVRRDVPKIQEKFRQTDNL